MMSFSLQYIYYFYIFTIVFTFSLEVEIPSSFQNVIFTRINNR